MLTFIALQVLDLITTLAAFSLGGHEANPIVKPFLSLGPVWGILAAKSLVLLAGLICWRYQKFSVIRKASWLYLGIVVWNVGMIAGDLLLNARGPSPELPTRLSSRSAIRTWPA